MAAHPRPLSPHLTVWRWGPGMAVSILHRITGAGLTIAGLALLTWWLMAIAGGAETYASFAGWMWADVSQLQWGGFATTVGSLVKVLLKLLLIGLTWAFFQHLLSGIRHLVMDSGQAFELRVNKRFAVLTVAGSIILTGALWVYVLGGRA